nr:hypothetical protein CFP56_19522 [Quercus suber]
MLEDRHLPPSPSTLPSAHPALFSTGTTGYIGGTVLHTLATTHPEYSLTVLLRTIPPNFRALYPSVHVVQGDYSSTTTLTQLAQASDIVVHSGDSDHEPSIRALIAGLVSRSTQSSTTPAFLIHLSGTGIISDQSDPTYHGLRNPHTWSDIHDLPAITSLPDTELHRPVDKIVLAAAAQHSVVLRTAIVCPPDIYGAGRGPGRTRSVFFPAYVHDSRALAAAFQAGDGGNVRAWVHIDDLMALYVHLIEAAAARGGAGADWNGEVTSLLCAPSLFSHPPDMKAEKTPTSSGLLLRRDAGARAARARPRRRPHPARARPRRHRGAAPARARRRPAAGLQRRGHVGPAGDVSVRGECAVARGPRGAAVRVCGGGAGAGGGDGGGDCGSVGVNRKSGFCEDEVLRFGGLNAAALERDGGRVVGLRSRSWKRRGPWDFVGSSRPLSCKKMTVLESSMPHETSLAVPFRQSVARQRCECPQDLSPDQPVSSREMTIRPSSPSSSCSEQPKGADRSTSSAALALLGLRAGPLLLEPQLAALALEYLLNACQHVVRRVRALAVLRPVRRHDDDGLVRDDLLAVPSHRDVAAGSPCMSARTVRLDPPFPLPASARGLPFANASTKKQTNEPRG